MDLRSPDWKTLVLVFILLILSLSAIAFLSFQTRDAMQEAVRNELKSVSSAVASEIDGDVFASIRPGDETTPEFESVRDTLHRIEKANPDLRYVYTMRRVDGGVEFVVDADYGYDPSAAMIGQIYPAINPDMIRGFEGASADTAFTTDQWGTVLSGYFPIQDRSGNVVGLVGVDIDRVKVIERLSYINWGFYLLIVISILMVGLSIAWVEKVRVEGESRIRENEERFRNLAVHTRCGIFMLREGTFQYTNPAMSRITGYPSGELAGKRFEELVHPQDRPRIAECTPEDADPPPPGGCELQIVCKDGSTRWVGVDMAAIPFEGTTTTIGSLYDITEIKQSEQMLQQINRKLSLLSSITLHDIRNSLGIVFGFIDLLRSSCTNPPDIVNLQKMECAAEAIQSQIDFAQIYQEIGIRSPEWQDVEALFDTTKVSLDLSALSFEMDTGDLSVFADPLLGRVFYTLMDNTLRHGQKASRIRITTMPVGSGISLVYEDDGIGVPESEKELIFQQGYGTNTGYGLFIAREILAITGIKIRECGIFSRSARFEISIPEGVFRKGSDAASGAANRDWLP